MMSELSFLIELLLNHDLPKATKDLVASRIKEVEANLNSNQVRPQIVQTQGYQAPSTLALMAKHGDLPPLVPTPVMPPVEQIAQTPAAAAAMNARNQAINKSINRKFDEVDTGHGTRGPKKW